MEKKEYIFNREITKNDVEDFNKSAPLIITIKNTKGQSPEVLRSLNENIQIKITGMYADNQYGDGVLYSPQELARVIELMNIFEKYIDPNWTDLEKATYIYIALIQLINQKNGIEGTKSNKDIRPLIQALQSNIDSIGGAYLYKELLERAGIACKCYQNGEKYAWNEVLIDGEYYPADVFKDAIDNKENLQKGRIELKSFLSNKEFYYMPEHNTGNKQDKKYSSLDHQKIQEAMNKVLHPEEFKEVVIPKIYLKSKEMQKIFASTEIDNVQDLEQQKEINIVFDNKDIKDIHEDLKQIAEYYPSVLNNVTLTNNSNEHINFQEIVDTIYTARNNAQNSVNVNTKPTKITIASSNPIDFDIDFSKAPKILKNNARKLDGETDLQKIAFVNTSSSPIKLPSLKGKLSNNIKAIEIHNCDVSNFDISVYNGPNGGVQLELVGGYIYGVSNITGLENVVELRTARLAPVEFEDVMDISVKNSTIMPKLCGVHIWGQNLQNRALFSEITNPNIIELEVANCAMNKATGIDNLKSQLMLLDLYENNFSSDDIRKINEILNEKKYISRCFQENQALYAEIDNLSGDIISDKTYNYLNEYFMRSGYTKYRELDVLNHNNISERKKQMLKDFSKYGLERVPYFIEDSELMRKVLPYTHNPIMIDGIDEFKDYIDNKINDFNKNYLKDATLWLTKEQIDYLLNSGKKIPQNICVKINTVSDLENGVLDNLKTSCDAKGLKLVGVNIFDDRCINSNKCNFDGIDTHLDTYSIDEYKKIRNSLEQISAGIRPSMTDIEKFAIVYQRLMQLIKYDDAVISDKLGKEHVIYQNKMFCKSRNLSEGLIEQEGFDINNNSVDRTLANRCVCAGYADILKNALELVGIPCLMVAGDATYDWTQNKPDATSGHEWNKVKIDGKWYYTDLCWDAGNDDYKYALREADKFEHSGYKRNENGKILEYDCHIPFCDPNDRTETVEQSDYDRAVLKDTFYRVKTGEIFKQPDIVIPDMPDFAFNPQYDKQKIKKMYIERKKDMLAKYYGDRDYQEKYNEISQRYRDNEIEVTQNGITYRTIRDYAEREDDERFLILGEYKNALERMTKYEAGDKSVYTGTQEQKEKCYQKDKTYVETRNYTFNQHKNTQNDLATLGKFGEELPYIPRQQGIFRNGIRIVGNTGIFIKNALAPIYRYIGRNIAQPLHRTITGNRDASPYRNNPYHRFVARRDYFKEKNQQQSPIINSVMSNVQAVFNYQEGNKAVIQAGEYDIQENIKEQIHQEEGLKFYDSKKIELEQQIKYLKDSITNSGDASNIDEVKRALKTREEKLKKIEESIVTARESGKIIDIQTDAISQKQHDIASKEVNTYRVIAIKGVSKAVACKFVGPKIDKWLLEHSKQQVPKKIEYQERVYVKEKVVKEVPNGGNTDINYDLKMGEVFENAKGKSVKMYRSVSGGNQGEVGYTITGNEACTGIHLQNGTKWGTGFSTDAPKMTDKILPTSLLNESGNLRNDITIDEIMKAISNGDISGDVLDNISIQIKDKGWVYAKELLNTNQNAGSKIIQKMVGERWTPKIVNKTKIIYETIENPRIQRILKRLKVNREVGSGIDTIQNVAEIARETSTHVENNKSQRQYDYDDSEIFR